MAIPLLAAGQVPTAAELNAIGSAEFPLNIDAWTAFTPTLVQSGTVAKTLTYARYTRIGRIILGECILTVTGSGTGANIVVAGLPVAAVAALAGAPVGFGTIFDTSASAYYKALATIGGGLSDVAFAACNTTTGGRLGVEAFTAGLAVGDQVAYSFQYEAAS